MKYIKSLNNYMSESRGSHEVDVEEIIDDLNSSLKYASAAIKDEKNGQVIVIYLDSEPDKDIKIAKRVISQYGGKITLNKKMSQDDTLVYQIGEGFIVSPRGTENLHENKPTIGDTEARFKSDHSNNKVNELLADAYDMALSEVKAYEGDDNSNHTIEGYMKELAALTAEKMYEMYESACNEMREGITAEMYESSCNEMKESYTNKMEEMLKNRINN